MPAAFLRSCRHFSMRHLRNRTLILRIRQNLCCPLHSIIVDRAEIRINHRRFFTIQNTIRYGNLEMIGKIYCYKSPVSKFHELLSLMFNLSALILLSSLVFFILINTCIPQKKFTINFACISPSFSSVIQL